MSKCTGTSIGKVTLAPWEPPLGMIALRESWYEGHVARRVFYVVTGPREHGDAPCVELAVACPSLSSVTPTCREREDIEGVAIRFERAPRSCYLRRLATDEDLATLFATLCAGRHSLDGWLELWRERACLLPEELARLERHAVAHVESA